MQETQETWYLSTTALPSWLIKLAITAATLKLGVPLTSGGPRQSLFHALQSPHPHFPEFPFSSPSAVIPQSFSSLGQDCSSLDKRGIPQFSHIWSGWPWLDTQSIMNLLRIMEDRTLLFLHPVPRDDGLHPSKCPQGDRKLTASLESFGERNEALFLFRCSVMSDSLWPPWTAALQAYLSFTISWSFLKLIFHWVNDITQPSHLLFPSSYCLQSFQASWSFPMSRLFTPGGQRTGVSTLASVLKMNIQGWFPLGLACWISLRSKGLSGVFSNTIWKHQFSVLSILHGSILTSVHDYWKNHSFDYRDLCRQNDVSAFYIPFYITANVLEEAGDWPHL